MAASFRGTYLLYFDTTLATELDRFTIILVDDRYRCRGRGVVSYRTSCGAGLDLGGV